MNKRTSRITRAICLILAVGMILTAVMSLFMYLF